MSEYGIFGDIFSTLFGDNDDGAAASSAKSAPINNDPDINVYGGISAMSEKLIGGVLDVLSKDEESDEYYNGGGSSMYLWLGLGIIVMLIIGVVWYVIANQEEEDPDEIEKKKKADEEKAAAAKNTPPYVPESDLIGGDQYGALPAPELLGQRRVVCIGQKGNGKDYRQSYRTDGSCGESEGYSGMDNIHAFKYQEAGTSPWCIGHATDPLDGSKKYMFMKGKNCKTGEWQHDDVVYLPDAPTYNGVSNEPIITFIDDYGHFRAGKASYMGGGDAIWSKYQTGYVAPR